VLEIDIGPRQPIHAATAQAGMQGDVELRLAFRPPLANDRPELFFFPWGWMPCSFVVFLAVIGEARRDHRKNPREFLRDGPENPRKLTFMRALAYERPETD
jgi:hypothetical protein